MSKAVFVTWLAERTSKNIFNILWNNVKRITSQQIFRFSNHFHTSLLLYLFSLPFTQNTSRMITLIETCFNTEDSSLYYLLLLRSFSSVDELESFYHNVYKPILARSATSSFMIPTLQEYQTMRHGENDYITNLTKLQVDVVACVWMKCRQRWTSLLWWLSGSSARISMWKGCARCCPRWARMLGFVGEWWLAIRVVLSGTHSQRTGGVDRRWVSFVVLERLVPSSATRPGVQDCKGAVRSQESSLGFYENALDGRVS